MSDNKIIVPLSILGVVIATIVIGGYFYSLNTKMAFSILLVLVALTTYFGFLMLPGGFNKESGFSESRIRLAIASTLTLTYLVYFCTGIFFMSDEVQNPVKMELLETLTNLLTIVLPFYFGATAVTEIVQYKSSQNNENSSKVEK